MEGDCLSSRVIPSAYRLRDGDADDSGLRRIFERPEKNRKKVIYLPVLSGIIWCGSHGSVRGPPAARSGQKPGIECAKKLTSEKNRRCIWWRRKNFITLHCRAVRSNPRRRARHNETSVTAVVHRWKSGQFSITRTTSTGAHADCVYSQTPSPLPGCPPPGCRRVRFPRHPSPACEQTRILTRCVSWQ